MEEKNRWPTISAVSRLVAYEKSTLSSKHGFESLLSLVVIFFLEIFLSVISLPLFLKRNHTLDYDLFNLPGNSFVVYRSRRRATLSVLGLSAATLFFYAGLVYFSAIRGQFTEASVTTGTIANGAGYAWSDTVGWIDFGTELGEVVVTDDEVTGYAWGENIGWVSLSCENDDSCGTVSYGVANDGEGNLSGYAWSDTVGFVNFNTSEYGEATIDEDGNWLGYAWGENIGWVSLSCENDDSCGTVSYGVETDWRPISARPLCNNTLDDDSDSLTDYPDDPGCSSLLDDDETDAPSTPTSTPTSTPPDDSDPEPTPSEQAAPVAEVRQGSPSLLMPIAPPAPTLQQDFAEILRLLQAEEGVGGPPDTVDPKTSVDKKEEKVDKKEETKRTSQPVRPPYGVYINNAAPTVDSRDVTLVIIAPAGTKSVVLSSKSDFSDYEVVPFAPKRPWKLTPGAGPKTLYARFLPARGGVLPTYISHTLLLEDFGD